jgi:hypothetical protein
VVPLAVSFCFFFACGCKFGTLGHPLCPQPGYCQDLRKAKLPYRQLNNLSCHIGNLYSRAHTHRGSAKHLWATTGV